AARAPALRERRPLKFVQSRQTRDSHKMLVILSAARALALRERRTPLKFAQSRQDPIARSSVTHLIPSSIVHAERASSPSPEERRGKMGRATSWVISMGGSP